MKNPPRIPEPGTGISMPAPYQPPVLWRLGSVAVMSSIGFICRTFLYGFNHMEVTGLENLLSILDRRKTEGKSSEGRKRGLLTVCNHVGVLDDPLMWGILPFKYQSDVQNLRWGLGAHDICFKNSFASAFFSLGQVLPTHRLWHSSLGGLHQPTMAQAIALLSGPQASPQASSLNLQYSTNGADSFIAPSAYLANRKAWVHVFPEACCHQGPASGLRYFKWGISRLILESEPAPDFIPMFIHGTQHIMPEDRGFPRFMPRIGKHIRLVIGESTNVEVKFGPQRRAWRRLVEKGSSENLQDGQEAKELRIEVAKAVRDEVKTLRLSLGLPADDDDFAELAETWSKEPNKRKFRSPVDGSLVNRH